MPVVMCSLALWKRIGAKRKLPSLTELEAAKTSLDEGCVLGNWSAMPVTLFRRPHVLFGNQETLLCVLVTLAPSKTLFERFSEELASELQRCGIDASTSAREASPLREPFFARNADRSLLGSLTDLTFHAQAYAAGDPSIDTHQPDLAYVQAELNETPHCNRPTSFADDAVRELFGLPKQPRQRASSILLH